VNADDPRDPSLDAAYRATAREEPPRALDERILSAAHRAVDARPKPVGRSFAQRWRVPVALAATVVLSVTVTLMVYESDKAPPVPEQLSPGKVREDLAAPAGLRHGDLKKDKESGASEPKPSTPAESPRVESPPAAPALGAPADEERLRQLEEREERVRQLQSQVPERKLSNEVRTAPAPFAAEPAAPAAPPAAAAPRANQPAAAKKREAPSAASAPAVESEPASSLTRERALGDRPAGRSERDAATGAAQPAPQSPESLIAEIRRLKQSGRTDEANRLLAALRERFPDYPLPEDLR
jgi:resuscitation-promoting factor RpfA